MRVIDAGSCLGWHRIDAALALMTYRLASLPRRAGFRRVAL